MRSALVLTVALLCAACGDKEALDPDGDGYEYPDDCDQNDPDVHPGAAEVPYDGVDNDCDAGTPDDDLDGDGYSVAQDCDDGDAAINPGATEDPYDGVDNDCDAGTPDDDLDGDGYALAQDCDDADAAINPDATEVCDAGDIDEDCDGDADDEDSSVDPSTLSTWHADGDGDGFGAGQAIQSCDSPQGYVANNTDCDDQEPSVYPGAPEICGDGLVNDCAATTADAFGACAYSGTVGLQSVGVKLWGAGVDDRIGSVVAGVGDMNGDGSDDLMISSGLWGATDDGAAYLVEGSANLSSGPVFAHREFIGSEADWLGNDLSAAGDVNNDGYADALVGAYGVGDSNDGGAYLLLGGVVLPSAGVLSATVPGSVVRFEGSLYGGELGRSVGGGGDGDGDGFDDLLIGAHTLDAAYSQGGGFFVIYGQQGAWTADVTLGDSCVGAATRCTRIDSDRAAEYLGRSLAWADVNGDGLYDILADSRGGEFASALNGVIYLILGDEFASGEDRTIDQVRTATFLGAANDNLGRAVGDGDFDGDGFPDILIGAGDSDEQEADAGMVYLIPGHGGLWNSDLRTGVVASFAGEAAGDRAGISVAYAGDVDGDGLSDVLIGAEQEATVGHHAGATYLVLGSADPATDYGLAFSLAGAQAKFTGENAEDLSGGSVAGAGDLNADGFDDMLIGARDAVIDGTDGGAAYILFGGGY